VRRDFRRVTHCIAIPMQACTQWTYSDILSQLATTPGCVFKISDWQSEKKWQNGDRRAICNVTRCIDARRRVHRHRGVSNGSDGARPIWRSHSARMEMFFADGKRSSRRGSPACTHADSQVGTDAGSQAGCQAGSQSGSQRGSQTGLQTGSQSGSLGAAHAAMQECQQLVSSLQLSLSTLKTGRGELIVSQI